MKNLISMLSDESGGISSKRVYLGLIILALVIDGILSIPFPQFKMDKNIIDALVVIAVMLGGGSTIDKFSKTVDNSDEKSKT